MNTEKATDRADEYLRTAIGHSTPDAITVCGRDLASELMGRMSFTQLTFLLVNGREATSAESQMLDAVLVSLADHGLTPTALAARLTLTGAPESMQGALAAGILGAGSVFLGPAEDTARFLDEWVDNTGLHQASASEQIDAAGRAAVVGAQRSGRRIPGLGHPVHREADPRTHRLAGLAESLGLATVRLKLLQAVARHYTTSTGRRLPVNGAGAAGAVLADLGFSPSGIRGIAVLARVAGLIGHLIEEEREPIGYPLWEEVEARAIYTAESTRDEPPDGDRQ